MKANEDNLVNVVDIGLVLSLATCFKPHLEFQLLIN